MTAITATSFVNDIPLSLAISAHAGTSHVPERRGDQERASYSAQHRQGFRRRYVVMIARLESLICATTQMRHLHGGKKLVPRWNDAPGRTAKDVLALLDMMATGKDDVIPFTFRDYTGRVTT